MNKELENFKLFLLHEGLKSSTVVRKIQAISYLIKKLKIITPKKAESFLFSQYQKGRKGGYLNIVISALIYWGKFKNIRGFDRIKLFKSTPSLKATMSDEEIRAFLTLPPKRVFNIGRHKKMYTYFYDPKTYDMWTVFFMILAYTGMRTGEVANLTVDSIDFVRNIFLVKESKTNQPRYVPIAASLIEPVKKHIETLTQDKLFPKANKSNWLYHFKNRIERLNIKRENLTPYSLRHSFITRMLSEDINLFKVQKIVGHKKADTTAQYTHLTTKDIFRTIQKDPLSNTIQNGILKKENSFSDRDYQNLLKIILNVARNQRKIINMINELRLQK